MYVCMFLALLSTRTPLPKGGHRSLYESSHGLGPLLRRASVAPGAKPRGGGTQASSRASKPGGGQSAGGQADADARGRLLAWEEAGRVLSCLPWRRSDPCMLLLAREEKWPVHALACLGGSWPCAVLLALEK